MYQESWIILQTHIRLTQAGYYWDAGYNEFDFICKIEGIEERIYMVQQRHDEGYGLVIRSEKDDIRSTFSMTDFRGCNV